MWNKYVLFVLFFVAFWSKSFAQGGLVTFSSSVPNNMEVCGVPRGFTLTINNPSAFTLSNVVLTIKMPVGVNYTPGSITGATELNLTIPNEPTFSLPNIPNLTYNIPITYQASADCNVMPFLALGGAPSNEIRLDYRANNINNYDLHFTASYNIRQPNISIINITNRSYSGNVGDVFVRCVTIKNSGAGSLSSLKLDHAHGAGIIVNSVTFNGVNIPPGANWTTSSNTEFYVLGAAHFASVGNGNALLDYNESVTICETIRVLDCRFVTSDYTSYWGCGSQVCQSSVSAGNVVFPNLTPNLIIQSIPSTNTCLGMGEVNQQTIKIINTGMGDALGVSLDIFQTTNVSYETNLSSNIDTGSFFVQYGSSGPIVKIFVDGSQATNSKPCLSANPQGRVFLTFPIISSLDTVILTWNSYNCCTSECGNGSRFIKRTRAQATYSNVCQNTYSTDNVIIIPGGNIEARLAKKEAPSNLNGNANESGSVSFQFSTYANTYPQAAGKYWEFVVKMPPCLTYNPGTFKIVSPTGITWPINSFTVTGNTLTVRYTVNPPTLLQATMSFDVTSDCTCGGGPQTIEVESYYVPDPNNGCACKVKVSCQNVTINVVCNNVCPEGMKFLDFSVKRKNFGLKDDNDNGLADSQTPADPNTNPLINDGLAMFGDTIKSIFTGAVQTSLTYPDFKHCYASSTVRWGALLSSLPATVKIWDASAAVYYTCTITGNETTTGNDRSFFYDLSADTLIARGFVLPGFRFSQDDSVWVTANYRLSYNFGDAILTPVFNNYFFLSNVPNATALPTDKFQCGTFDGAINIIGYTFETKDPESHYVSSCERVTLSQDYVMKIGPSGTGSNMFRYEYRNFSHLTTFAIIMPPGFKYISAYFYETRTSGSLSSFQSPNQILTNPVIKGDTVVFDIRPFYASNGGQISKSDEGFQGRFFILIEPSCSSIPNVEQEVKYYYQFFESSNLVGSSTPLEETASQDEITYNQPQLSLEALLPNIDAPDKIAEWELRVKNTSNSKAHNGWLSFPKISGVETIEVYDVDKSATVPLNGNIYQIDSIEGGNITRVFKVRATYTSCSPDSIVGYLGWNCSDGYPADIGSYPCSTYQINLSLRPQIATLFNNSSAPPEKPLCDTTEFTLNCINAQIGTAYDIKLKVTLPFEVDFVPGSSKIAYPDTNYYSAIPDPTFVSGTVWEWDLGDVNSAIDTNGLKGILQPTLSIANIRFKIINKCNYISGSKLSFIMSGKNGCGTSIEENLYVSDPLLINGTVQPYSTRIQLTSSYVSPCRGATGMNVTINNNGSLSFSLVDSIIIELPYGVTYVPGSFEGIHRPPNTSEPQKFSVNGINYLLWQLSPGVPAFDSSVFNFKFIADPALVTCGITQFTAQTVSVDNVVCVSMQPFGTTCSVKILTGDTLLDIFKYKADLKLINGTASAKLNPTTGETVTLNFDLANYGETISSDYPTTVSYYHDADGNGIHSAPDQLITNQTFYKEVLNNDTISHSATIDVPAGLSCSIIAKIDSSVSFCACKSTELLFNVPLQDSGQYELCTGDIEPIGKVAVTGYGYSWNPATFLTDPNVANPTAAVINNTQIPDTVKYAVTTNRIACISIDTVVLTINPFPIINTSGTSTICIGDSIMLYAFSSTASVFNWSPSTDIITNMNDSILVKPSSAITISVSGSNGYGCVSDSSAGVIVLQLPVIQLSNDTTICPGSATALYANGANTYEWSPPDFLVGSTTGVSVNTAATSPISYVVKGTDINQCVGYNTINISMVPPPIITVSPNTNVCEGDSVLLQVNGDAINYKWSPDTWLNEVDGISVYSAPLQDIIYTVTGYNQCGDSSLASTNVFLRPNPSPSFTTDKMSGCMPLCVNFVDLSSISSGNITSWQWSFGDSSIAMQKDTAYCYQTPGSYSVSLSVTSSYACTSILNNATEINVYPNPVAEFSMSPETPSLIVPTVYFTDKSVDAVSWKWDFNDLNDSQTSDLQNPEHTFQDTGSFCPLLTIKNIYDCVDSIQECLVVTAEHSFYLSNTFTPNGDNINDIYFPKGVGLKEIEFWIFDRWGQKLFYTNKYGEGWDGIYRGVHVQNGMYAWKAKVVDILDNKRIYQGNVFVVR